MALSVSSSPGNATHFGSTGVLAWRPSSPSDFATVFTTLFAALLVSVYLRAQSQKQKSVSTLPPGPKPWPILGNLLALADGMPHHALQRLASKYGGIMYLRLGSVPCLIISTAAAAKEVFQTNDVSFSSRPKGLYFEIISDNYKTLVLTPYGPYWRQLRKFSSSELFSAKRHASYRGVREEELRNMLAILLETSEKGEAVNVKSWLYEVSANVMTRMLINKRYFGKGGASQEEKADFERLIAAMTRVDFAAVISDFIPNLTFLTKLQGYNKIFKGIRDDAIRIGGKMLEVEKHRERAKERGSNDQDEYVPDFVDMLSEEPLDGGKPLPDEQLTLVLLELFNAGTETGSTTVEWAMAELILRPELLKQAQAELDTVVGNDRLMQESDLPNLPFLQAIVKETFRLHPPAPLAPPRESFQPAQAYGYQIPAGTRLMLNLCAIHRDPAVYESPDEFIPQRFVDRPELNHLSGFDSYELIPFGVGRRMCPGYNLGNTLVTLMLGNLLHSYDWSLPHGQSIESFDMTESFGITVCRKEPLYLMAKPRDHVVSC
ncbi:hypothetical protein M758_12G159400 [Ceratodon purpureus]|nr:hypothetical protein M758_12G159400 [Ceratodon purpureus]